GSRERKYRVFVPATYDPHTPVPMLMVLHGCKQTEQNMIDETNFDALAEREGFIVVYPFVTSYDGWRAENCWGFWFDHHIHAGAGEVEDLYQLAREVEARFAIDPQRRYVTGLSSGGGMAVALAVARSEYFAAAGAAAGVAYGESSWAVSFSCMIGGFFETVDSSVASMRGEQTTSADQRPIPVMTVQSKNDCTVNARAAEHIRDAWLTRYGVSTTPYETVDCSNEGVPCKREKYGSAQHSLVETVFYEGATGGFSGSGAHYWVGDDAGPFANPTGPSASELFWDFFRQHRFDDTTALAGIP
ncbi:MAG TPA: PHB depolymerase family esterase, partial [Polyangiaceae bacterium]|nr:PHB depolymerase family esterase [Polyangiaceae bacterium]